VLGASASNTAGFLLRGSCVFSSQVNRPIRNKMILIHPENSDWQEYSIQKVIQVSLVNNALRAWASDPDCSLSEIHAFHHLRWIGLWETKWTFVQVGNSDLQEVFFPKLTQFSQGNNMVDAAASNINGFLWRDTCVSSPMMNSPIWNKMSLSPLWNTLSRRKYSFQ
jgi:hypothetical protein